MKQIFNFKWKNYFPILFISLGLGLSPETFGQFPLPYCSAAFPGDVQPITRVEFENIDNSSSDTINASPDLEDFTLLQAEVLRGQTYPITVRGNTDGLNSSPAKVTVFIDWNQNDTFDDPGEMYSLTDLENSDGLDNVVSDGFISVPNNAELGQTRMRVMKNYQLAPVPCNNAGIGQAEDYSIMVYATTCSGSPNVGTLQSTNDTLCGEEAFTIYSSIEKEMGLTFEWQEFSINANDWITIFNQNDTFLNFPDGISYTTEYRFIATCMAESDTSDIIKIEITSASIDSIDITDNGSLSFTFIPVNPKNVDEYFWDFGDGGANSTDPNPTYVYDQHGEYEVSLIISNDCGEDTIKITLNTNPVGINDLGQYETGLTIYPNPANSVLNIKSDLKEEFHHLEIYDISGRKIKSQTSNHSAMESISIKGLESGNYILNIHLKSGEIISRKFKVID